MNLGSSRPLEALKLANAIHRARRSAPEVLNIMRSLAGQGMSYRAIAREFEPAQYQDGQGQPMIRRDGKGGTAAGEADERAA